MSNLVQSNLRLRLISHDNCWGDESELWIFHSAVGETSGEDNNCVDPPLVGNLGVFFDVLNIDLKVLEFLGTEINSGGLSDDGTSFSDIFLDEVTRNEGEKVGGDSDILLEDGDSLSPSRGGRLQDSCHVDTQISGESNRTIEGRFNIGGILAGEDSS